MKPSRFSTDGRFARLFRESLAILAAILAAFALDAWWEERREYGQMLDALDAVGVEIDRNIALLDNAIDYNRAQAERGFRIVRLAPEDISALPADEVADLAGFPSYNLVRLQLGAATAFIEGGFLAVLPDREVRAEIAGLPRIQEEIDEEMLAVLGAQEQLEETMSVNLPVEEVIAMMEDPSMTATSMLRGVASNDDARRALIFRSFFLGQLYASELEEARDLLETTRSHIDRFSP